MVPVTDELAVTFPVSKPTDKSRKAILERAAAHAVELSAIDSAVDELLATTWSPEYDERAGQLRTRQRASLVEEIAIREAVDQWFNQVATVDWPIARDAAIASHDRVKADVEKRLLSIGYEKMTDLGGGAVREELPPLILSHPEVRAAMLRVQSLSDHDTQSRRQANAAALEACRKQLAEYQSRATAGLAA